MAKFETIFTDIEHVNGGNQFGNEPLSSNAINVALQNTQAIKDGGTTVGKAQSAENATNAENATEANHCRQANYSAFLNGANTQIKLGDFTSTGRPITQTEIAFKEGDYIVYLEKQYYIHINLFGKPEVNCSAKDPIYSVATDTAITVKKNVSKNDILLFDKKWATSAAGGTFTVANGDTYQIELGESDSYTTQAIITITGTGEYFVGTRVLKDTIGSGGIYAHTYRAWVDTSYRLTCYDAIVKFSDGTQTLQDVAFKIRQLNR